MSNIQHEQPLLSMVDLETIFTHFSPQDIEGFYQLYQLWTLKQRREEVVARMHELTQQIVENEVQLKATSPSTIALATLSQFQASGVDDVDLLDRMLERGDQWLDHTLQLFERCERMDMIQGNATEWCEHALEGAYEWIESMNETNEQDDSDNPDDDTIINLSTTSTNQILSEGEVETLPETTEEDFLQKLMSEDGEAQEQPEENKVVDEQIEQEDHPLEAVLAHVSEHEEIEYAIPDRLPEIQQENEPIETPPQDQEEHAQPVEQEDDTTAQVNEGEEIADTILTGSPEVQHESEPPEITYDDQTENISPAEQDTIDEDKQAEDSAIDGAKEEEENTIETPSIELNEADELNEAETEDIASKDVIEASSLVLNEPDIEEPAKEEEVSEPQEDIDISDAVEEGETQQIKAISYDEQAHKQQGNRDLTDEDTAQSLQTADEISSSNPTITPDTDITASLAAIKTDEIYTNAQNEQEEKKPQKQQQPKRRGFFRRLLAKLLHRR